MNLTAGTPLQNGKYVLNHLLGQSALGVTLKATQAQLNQAVVLKTLRLQPNVDSAHLKQHFLEETRRFAQCQHPGLVRVLDSFTEAGLPFAVMDYVAGQTLAEQVQSRELLPEAQVLQYIRQAGSALSVIHRQGLLHRDVKPNNLVRPKGATFVVLVDFSIAHGTGLNVTDHAESLLTNPYAAIELHQPEATLTVAADIYALAATLYFLVTRHTPIPASRRQQLPLVPPRQLQPHLSAAIEHAILSGMALNPQERPQTIAAWFALLPDSNPLPAVQGFGNGNGNGAEPLRAAIDPLHAASSNGSARPTAPPALPTLTHHATHTAAPVMTAAPSNVVATPVRATKSRLPKALGMTAAIAIAGGVGLGLALRFSAMNGIGPTFFQTKQDFPPMQDWPLQATSTDVVPATTAVPEPEPLRNVIPDRPLRMRAIPRPSVAPVAPTPLPTATIEATPTPLPSAINPDVQPTPLPSSAPPTNPTPRPLPSVLPPVNSSGYPLQQPNTGRSSN